MGLYLRPDPYLTRVASGGGSSGVAAPFATVLGPNDGQFGPWVGDSPYEGFVVDYASQPAASPMETYDFTRAGWVVTDSATTDTSATTTHALQNTVTKAIRQPAPVGGAPYQTQSALAAALATYHFVDTIDTIEGNPTNNSTLVPPKPGARHASTPRRVWGDTFHGEIIVLSTNGRNQKQVAGAVCTLTSAGTGTAVASVSTVTILGHVGDQFAVLGLEVDIDITGLSDNQTFTEDWVVYPHFGTTTASQRRTVDGNSANLWEFSTRTHLRATTKASNPFKVAVASTGTDETVNTSGVGGTSGLTKVSQTEATCLLSPFQSVQSAIQALDAATALTGGITDGCEVLIVDGVTLAGSFLAGTYQTNAELVIRKATASTRAAAVVTVGSAAINMRHSWVRFYDVSVSRSGGTNQISGVSGQVVFENCNLDNASRASTPIGTVGAVQAYMGVAISNATIQMVAASGNNATILARGIDLVSGTIAIEFGCVVGCRIPNATASFNTTRQVSNIIWAFNQVHSCTNAAIGANAIAHDGIFIAQNDFEFISATTNPISRINSDDATPTTCTNHADLFNTYAGASLAGRHNQNYDETDLIPRRQKFITKKGNIIPQMNMKGDGFHYDNDLNPEGYTVGSPSEHIGNWAPRYGVDCAYNYINYGCPNQNTEPQDYAGIGSVQGTSTTVPVTAVTSLFEDYQGTTYTTPFASYTAGAGGGDNRPKTGTDVRDVVPFEHSQFPYDLLGNARSTTADTIGAYA